MTVSNSITSSDCTFLLYLKEMNHYSIIVLVVILAILAEIFNFFGFLLLGIAACILLLVLFQILIEVVYYNSRKFKKIRRSLTDNAAKYNELNEHLESLKSNYLNFTAKSYGKAKYKDESPWHYKRPDLGKVANNSANIYYCSLSVCKNAQAQPFKYLCKYFGIDISEKNLSLFEEMSNNFSAIKDGQDILQNEREQIIDSFRHSIPYTIRKYRIKHFFKKLGFARLDLSTYYYPTYYFKYISAGGRSSMECEIILGEENLEEFVSYLFSEVKKTKTVKYQRALMTSELRSYIISRDNYRCKKCGASQYDEPNLLLEVDHIIPVSKGGKTIKSNLQTLCWRCNRSKGNKMAEACSSLHIQNTGLAEIV